MKFGPVAVADSEGAVLAHTLRTEKLTLKKGTKLDAGHVRAMREAGVEQVTVARLEDGDVGEDVAALRLADRVTGANLRVEAPFTGRSNIFATAKGVFLFDSDRVRRFNSVHESITFATLPAFRPVTDGEMVATVKIIPYAVEGALVARADALAERPLIEVRPFVPLRLGVVSTLLPGLKPSVVDKTLRALRERIAPAAAEIVAERRVPHERDPLAAAVREIAGRCDLVVIFGASAITDRRDVVPAAVVDAGGSVEHLGMPVDPGNLLLLGRTAQGRPLLGAPGCARSPKENGFDWVLQRMLAQLEVTGADIIEMGSGGLLMEIISRPQPRADASADVETHAQRLENDDG